MAARSKGLPLLSVFPDAKLGLTTPSVGMAEVGVDLPLEGVVVLGVAASPPLKGRRTGVFGVDSVCKKATKA